MRVLSCPTCGDKERVQKVVFGMPAGQPSAEDEERYFYAGCVIEEPINGDWYCPACEQFYSRADAG